jgi:hypothetical protein
MFDLLRFARLAAAEWVERRREWGWFFLALVVLHFVIVLLMLITEDGYRGLSIDGQKSLFFTGLFIAGSIFAARYFQPLARPGAELLALMRPATALEKWVLAVLVIAVAFPLAYHVVFFACDVPAVLIARGRAAADLAELLAKDPDISGYFRDVLEPANYGIFNIGDTGGRDLVGLILMLTTLQAFTVACSLLFRRSPFIKTLLAGFLVLLLLVLVGMMTYTHVGADPDHFLTYWGSSQGFSTSQAIVYPLVWVVVPALLWACALLALREREVA